MNFVILGMLALSQALKRNEGGGVLTAQVLFEGKGLHTVIRFVSTGAKFGIYTVVGLHGTLVEDKMRTFKGDCKHFSFTPPYNVYLTCH
jgi:hypothetical protein